MVIPTGRSAAVAALAAFGATVPTDVAEMPEYHFMRLLLVAVAAHLPGLGARISGQIDRLGRLTDVIYVHIDMDVLDPAEVTGHPLTAPEGPTSAMVWPAGATNETFSTAARPSL